MGILVGPTYNTDEGFIISWMYLDIQSLRFVTTLSGNTLSAVFVVSAYKSVEDRRQVPFLSAYLIISVRQRPSLILRSFT